MILTSARRRAAIPPLLALALATPGVSTSATAGAAPCASDAPRLVISHAGSLTSSFVPVEAEFTRRTGVCVVDLSGGSVKLARDLGRDGGGIDIFASADAEVNERMLKPAGIVTYTIRFAEGRMVLAYTGASKGAATIAAAAAPGTIAQAAPDWAGKA